MLKIQSIICNKSCWVIQKTGLGGMAANKGACGIRCLFGTTSFAFVTCHLAAGTLAVTERYNDYSTIMQGLVFPVIIILKIMIT